ncbi:MAG TPA: hypothetical protein VI895_01260 [Bdellovibrionota bacterium]|nr:hypothetical protein [Bdellovibrionota bacterium]
MRDVKAAVRPAHQVRRDVIRENSRFVQAGNQGEAKDLRSALSAHGEGLGFAPLHAAVPLKVRWDSWIPDLLRDGFQWKNIKLMLGAVALFMVWTIVGQEMFRSVFYKREKTWRFLIPVEKTAADSCGSWLRRWFPRALYFSDQKNDFGWSLNVGGEWNMKPWMKVDNFRLLGEISQHRFFSNRLSCIRLKPKSR